MSPLLALSLLTLSADPVELLDPTELGDVPPMVTVDGDRYDIDGKKVKDLPFLGLAVDVGVPDGAGASMVANPASWVRVQLGGLTNLGGPGFRLGATLVLFPSWRLFHFTLSGDVGSFSGSNLSWVVTDASQRALAQSLSSVSYVFGAAHGGIEVGTRNVSIALRVGVAWLDGTVAGNSTDFGKTTLTASGLHLSGFIPSARLGLTFGFG